MLPIVIWRNMFYVVIFSLKIFVKLIIYWFVVMFKCKKTYIRRINAYYSLLQAIQNYSCDINHIFVVMTTHYKNDVYH